MSFSDNPYAQPTPSAQGYVPRPGGLTAIAIVCLILGGLGLMSSSIGCLSQFLAGQFQGLGTMGVPPEMKEAQVKMNEKVLAVQKSFVIPMIIGSVLKFIMCGLLVIGSVLVMRARNRSILSAGCWMGLVVEPLMLLMAVITQLRIGPIMQEGFRDMQGGQAEAIGQMAGFFMIVGVVIGAVWGLFKIIYFGTCVWYLRRPNVVALFPVTATTTDMPR